MALATVVVGAGPAGLLFSVVARILGEQRGVRWPIVLVDKRTEYARTHRLRIAPASWLAIRDALRDPRFDALIAWLEERRFTPAVNELEAHLSALASELGVRRETLEVRALADVRGLAPEATLTVVGADSVHSTVRELVRGDVPSREHTHQRVVRLRVDGPGLPDHLGAVEQIRLSKLVDSLVDYRLNPNGFAEVDVFLSEREHPRLAELGANPKGTVALTDERVAALRGVPLFSRIVAHLRRGFGAGPCEVQVYSTFVLEHRTIEQVAFPRPDGWVFLLGDAAVSLPFFRGMSCLAACAYALARVHVELATAEDADPRRYDADVAAIRAEELAVVERRARMVATAREVARVSALLPFPIQTWLTSAPEPAGGGPTVGFLVNVALASVAAAIALAAPVLDAFVWAPLGWLWLLALPVQALGGAAYYAARVLEPGPDVWVRRVWRWQVGLLLVAGTTITLVNSWHLARAAQLHSLVSWWVLGMTFVVGLYGFERVQHRSWTSADLDL